MWSGTVAFGLVTLPVRLHPAVRSSHLSLKRTRTAEGQPVLLPSLLVGQHGRAVEP